MLPIVCRLDKLTVVLFETIRTIDGTHSAGTEGDLGDSATFGAHGLMHFSALSRVLFALAATFGAAARIAAKSFRGVKLLFACGKNEFLATIGTG